VDMFRFLAEQLGHGTEYCPNPFSWLWQNIVGLVESATLTGPSAVCQWCCIRHWTQPGVQGHHTAEALSMCCPAHNVSGKKV